jgi:hypothetical protein
MDSHSNIDFMQLPCMNHDQSALGQSNGDCFSMDSHSNIDFMQLPCMNHNQSALGQSNSDELLIGERTC